MKNKIYGLILALALSVPALIFAGNGDSESTAYDQLGLTQSGGTYVHRVSSSGHVIPGPDSDLGTPNAPWRNLFVSSFTNVGSGAVHISSTGISIAVAKSYVIITSTGGPLNMTATPNISTATARNGDQLCVMSSTASITINDRLSLVNTGVALGAATRTLGVNDNICFTFVASTGAWVERSFTNVQ